MAKSAEFSNAQARRIALAAQGFTDPRPTGRVDRRHLRRVVDRMGLIQIDSVNVLVRSQELPLFARLGPHPRSLIPDASRDGELFEYWVHEACHVPVASAPVPALADEQRAPVEGRRRAASSTAGVHRRGPHQDPRRGPPRGRRPRTSVSARRAHGGTGTTARSRSSTCSSPARWRRSADRTTSPESTTSPSG